LITSHPPARPLPRSSIAGHSGPAIHGLITLCQRQQKSRAINLYLHYTVYCMAISKQRPTRHPSETRAGPDRKPVVPAPRNPVQLDADAKGKLDIIKQSQPDVRTYNDAIRFLFRQWRSSIPSSAGAFAGLGPFERDEEDDPYRTPS
jgi:hypothetical protein